jgi:hypothetical protein
LKRGSLTLFRDLQLHPGDCFGFGFQFDYVIINLSQQLPRSIDRKGGSTFGEFEICSTTMTMTDFLIRKYNHHSNYTSALGDVIKKSTSDTSPRPLDGGESGSISTPDVLRGPQRSHSHDYHYYYHPDDMQLAHPPEFTRQERSCHLIRFIHLWSE